MIDSKIGRLDTELELGCITASQELVPALHVNPLIRPSLQFADSSVLVPKDTANMSCSLDILRDSGVMTYAGRD